ncbi:MAG: heavy metal translocating P-type ATPase [Bacillota bacterium]
MTNINKEKIKSEEELEIEGLNCTNCANKIEKEINNLSYIDEAELNFAKSTIKVKGESGEKKLTEIQKIADRIEPGVKIKSKNQDKKEADIEEENNFSYKNKLIMGSILFVMAILTDKINFFAANIPQFIPLAFYITSYLLVGGRVLKTAYRNIKRGSVFDENFLMVIATFGAFAIKEYPEAVAVMLFYMIGEIFQDKAVSRSRRSIKELMDIQANFAWLKTKNGLKKMKPENIDIGDTIVVKAGEKVPLDGIVKKGSSRLDTSALTGESEPRKVEKGEEILSGVINKDGLLEIEVTDSYEDSTVSRILELVENASSKKAKTEKFITKFARYYTPGVVYTAMAVAIIPPLLLSGANFSEWFYRALIFLVISCPCALVVSIPLGFFGGIGRASKEGVLVKGGNYLEALNNVEKIVFDKTGTLTEGKFKVNKIKAVNNFSKKEILKLSALVENNSTHPLALSIVKKYKNEFGPLENEVKLKKYNEISGRGISAIINNKNIILGNKKLFNEKDISISNGDEKINNEGTVVYVAVNKKYAGYLLISDQEKVDSKGTVSELKKKGKEIIMLTGDRNESAKTIAAKLGIDKYFAELLPDEKVKKVEELISKKDKNSRLIFVGDGINDAPVLARSDIGVAMGGLGSDAAIEAADIVLMDDKPSTLLTAFNIASKTRKIVWQNIIMALGVKFLVLSLGLFGMATMWEAVFADVGVALLAVLNSMRIFKFEN